MPRKKMKKFQNSNSRSNKTLNAAARFHFQYNLHHNVGHDKQRSKLFKRGGGGEFFLKKDMYDNDMRGCKKKLKKKGKRGRKQNLELERERW